MNFNTHLKTILAALLLGVAGSASAAVLTFDDLTSFMYGNGEPLLASMAYDGLSLTYQEAGYQLTLHTPNAPAGAAHISDGTYEPQTFNWHDGVENGADAYVTVTRVGGGLFNLLGFQYYTDGISVLADGLLAGAIEGYGNWDMALNGISELRFTSSAYNELDNISVDTASTPLPLPGTLPLLMGALGLAALLRRRQHSATAR